MSRTGTTNGPECCLLTGVHATRVGESSLGAGSEVVAAGVQESSYRGRDIGRYVAAEGCHLPHQ